MLHYFGRPAGYVLLAWSAVSAVFVIVAYVRTCAQGSPLEIRIRRFRLALSLSGVAIFSILAAGLVAGAVPNVFHFFRPRDGNPYVVTSHAVMAIVWMAVAVWLYLLGGADRLARPSGTNGDAERGGQADAGPWSFLASPAHIKGFFAVCLGGAVVCEVVLWLVDLPPSFP